MPSTDRRMIAPLMVPHFPTMEEWTETVLIGLDEEGNKIEQTITHPTSDEWHGFLNAMTGLNISMSEFNTSAFDRWRQALAMQFDLPVWPYTAARIAEMQARGDELKAAEDARQAALPVTLGLLQQIAPTKSAEQILADEQR